MSRLVVVGSIGGLLLWLFAPAVVGTQGFVFRDAAHYYHPLFDYIRGECLSGRLPLWNPHDNAGMPLVGDATSSVFYPGKFLFLLPVEYTLLYNIYIVSHLVLAGYTAWRLARHWGATTLGAGLAALSYAFCGNVLFQYANVVYLVGAAWLPWAVLQADRMLVERRTAAAIGLGGTLALMTLGGDPQMAYNAILIVGLYAFMKWRIERTIAPESTTRWAKLGAIAVTTWLGLAAVQILPSIEASKLSQRASFDAPRSWLELVAGSEESRDQHAESKTAPPPPTGERSWSDGLLKGSMSGYQRQVYAFSVGPWRAMEFVWPNVSGRMFPTHKRWLAALGAEGRTWVPSLYMGLLPFLLAVMNWNLRGSDVRVRWLSWIVLLSALASFGIYGGAWVTREMNVALGGSHQPVVGDEVGGLYWLLTVALPGYVYFRYPAKLLVVASLGLSLLAARGWDELSQQPSAALRRLLIALAGLSGAGWVATWLLWPSIEGHFDRIPADPLFGPFDMLGARHDILSAFAQTAIVSAVLLAILRLQETRPSLRGLAFVVTAVEMAVAQSWLVPTAPAIAWQTEPGVARVIPRSADEYRIYRDPRWRPDAWRRTASAERQTAIVSWDRETLAPKYHLPYRLSVVESSDALASADYEALLDVARSHGQSGTREIRPHESVLDLLGARIALVPEALVAVDPGRPGEKVEGAAIRFRESALPRSWIVHQVTVLDPLESRSPERIRQRTEEVLFPEGRPRDWRHEAVVETGAPLGESLSVSLPAGDGTATEECRVVYSTPSQVEIEAKLSSPSLVVLRDLYYPGWQLTIESAGSMRDATILRTNRVMRGVALPAGEHRLVFRYCPRSVFIGGAISMLACALLAIGFVAARRRKRRGAPEERPASA